ncbi:MAG: hypothetical protein QM755_02840 [Luteolibacter sp.]
MPSSDIQVIRVGTSPAVVNVAQGPTGPTGPVDTTTAAALATEVTRALTAESALDERIDDEAATRTAADSAIATALADESTRATSAEDELSAQIASESSAREAADQINAEAIESEATARASGDITAATNLSAHTTRTDNPHSVTKSQIGLGNVDNTSDANKPVSTAQAAADTAVASSASSALSAHTGNTSNPHNVTKTQVGLGNVPDIDATDRTNHTGTQQISTIANLQATLDTKSTVSYRFVSDVDVALADSDRAVIYETLTAARSATLPAANSAPGGTLVMIVDRSGSASPTSPIFINPAGSDAFYASNGSVTGLGTWAITRANGWLLAVSDGVGKWTGLIPACGIADVAGLQTALNDKADALPSYIVLSGLTAPLSSNGKYFLNGAKLWTLGDTLARIQKVGTTWRIYDVTGTELFRANAGTTTTPDQVPSWFDWGGSATGVLALAAPATVNLRDFRLRSNHEGDTSSNSYTVANLPELGPGHTAFASDSTTPLASGLGNIVMGGGSNFVPVYSDGTNWRIG